MEHWKEVMGFEDYEVSDLGRVRNANTRHILKPYYEEDGYGQLTLTRNKYRYLRYVHRLVAIAFCEGYSLGLEVNHEDGDKSHNYASNLKWVTHSENIEHAYRTGLSKNTNKDKRKRIQIIETGEEFESLTECAKHLETNRSFICNVLKGKQLRAKGYTFRYI